MDESIWHQLLLTIESESASTVGREHLDRLSRAERYRFERGDLVVQEIQAHGFEKIDREFSNYFLADELQATYRGMMIAIPEENWTVFEDMNSAQLAAVVLELASQINLKLFRKSSRGPKKPRPKRKGDKPHISTARLLTARSRKPAEAQ